MIEVAPGLSIDDTEIHLEFIRASGPGGQHVNKASTAVQLFFDVAHSASLPEGVRQRLITLAGKRVTDDGVLIIEARQSRSQDQNRQDAIDRLIELVRRAATPPKKRRKTRPSEASRKRRLETKRRRSETKRHRQRVHHSEN